MTGQGLGARLEFWHHANCCGGRAPDIDPVSGTSVWQGIIDILAAVASGDAWLIYEALGHRAAYVLAVPVVIVFGLMLMRLLQRFPVLDRNLEKYALVSIYLVISTVIFVEVIRRFVFQTQVPWSTTLPPYLFLVMTWMGCAYNTKLRTHLSFSEMRMNMSRNGQLACLALDAVLWFAFSIIVIVTTLRQTANAAANSQFLLGTDNVMQWWFYIFVPLSWLLLCARVFENFIEDLRRYDSGEELVRPSVLGGE